MRRTGEVHWAPYNAEVYPVAKCCLFLSLLFAITTSAQTATAPPDPQELPANAASGGPDVTPIKLGPLTITGSWRVRFEAWNWFTGDAENTYSYAHSILRVGISQQLH